VSFTGFRAPRSRRTVVDGPCGLAVGSPCRRGGLLDHISGWRALQGRQFALIEGGDDMWPGCHRKPAPLDVAREGDIGLPSQATGRRRRRRPRPVAPAGAEGAAGARAFEKSAGGRGGHRAHALWPGRRPATALESGDGRKGPMAPATLPSPGRLGGMVRAPIARRPRPPRLRIPRDLAAAYFRPHPRRIAELGGPDPRFRPGAVGPRSAKLGVLGQKASF